MRIWVRGVCSDAACRIVYVNRIFYQLERLAIARLVGAVL